MRNRNKLIKCLALMMLMASVAVAAAPDPATVQITGTLGLSEALEHSCLAVWVPVGADAALGGIRWYNNDGTVAFPAVLVQSGAPEYPVSLTDAFEVAQQVTGVSSGWSALTFSEPVAALGAGLYVILQVPAGAVATSEGAGGGPALGYTLQLPTEDRYLTSKTDILNRLCVLMGGRCAEELTFSEITTGASDDLNKATSYARKMVTELGMSDAIGPIIYKKDEGEVFLGRDIARGQNYSDATAQAIDAEVKKILGECYEKTRGILTKNKALLEQIANRLLEKEVVEASELDEMLAKAVFVQASA